MRGAAVPGAGAYDASYALTEPAAAAAGFSKLPRGLGEGVPSGESPEEEATISVVPPAQGDVLDLDPVAAFATAVARRATKGAHVDIGRMTNPRVDAGKRAEARAVAAAGLDAAGREGLYVALKDAHWSALYREPMTCDFVGFFVQSVSLFVVCGPSPLAGGARSSGSDSAATTTTPPAATTRLRWSTR
jgi:hypothetical protein